MKRAKTTLNIEPAGFFAWRSPLLSFDDLRSWSDGLEAKSAVEDDGRVAAALAADRATLRERLKRIIRRPVVREALFIASPTLDESLGAWREAPESRRGQKVERTLVKYLVRMAGRATPFGLFSGCSTGTLASETSLRLAPGEEIRRRTRLDMDYLCALSEALSAEPSTRGSLAYRPNSSLYRAADHLRYIEGRLDPLTRSREYSLSEVETTEYLEATLERAAAGARPGELAAALVDGDISLDDAEGFVGELIDSQLLVSELEPAVTGEEALDDFLSRLEERPALAAAAAVLRETRRGLEALDERGPGADPGEYRRIASGLEELPAAIDLPRLFQVDMIKPAREATLGRAVTREIHRGIDVLHSLADEGDDALTGFRSAFRRRYEDREVRLVDALDEELGVGFEASEHPEAEASPLLAGLDFPGIAEVPSVRWGQAEALKLELLQASSQDRRPEVSLTQEDLRALKEAGARRPLPGAFSVLASLAAASREAVMRGEFRLLVRGVSGPSGAVLLGRFCNADPALRRHVEQHLRAEEALRPDAAYVEIVHLPQGRVGNILFRPVLRQVEIPYLGRSGAPPENQLPVTDLTVSVVRGRVVLRSARLGREVIPRLTSAHNFHHRSLGIYRFLCCLQGQGRAAGLGWSWGPLAGAPFLPRVVSGRLVLSRAAWNLDGADLRELGAAGGSDGVFRAVQRLRARRSLPRWVALSDHDNELPVDLDSVLHVETFAHLARRRRHVRLVEMFPDPDSLVAEGPEGRFVHELVVPFVQQEGGADLPAPSRSPSPAAAAPGAGRRAFAPGSEWLYIKLYTGTSTADQVLEELVRPVVDATLAAGAADGWHFIRYGDPDWHLRFRLHGDPGRLQASALPLLQARAAGLLDDGRLWRVQLDTYRREVERYGGSDEALVLAEKVFQADSEAALAIVERLGGDEGLDARWRLALRGIHLLLVDLGLDLAARLTAMKRARAAFGEEFSVDVTLARGLGSKFRSERPQLEALLDPRIEERVDPDSMFASGLAALRARSDRLSPHVSALWSLSRSGRLTLPVEEMAHSFVHMHANRLLRSAARAQELVLYDFLGRLYQTEVKRGAGA